MKCIWAYFATEPCGRFSQIKPPLGNDIWPSSYFLLSVVKVWESPNPVFVIDHAHKQLGDQTERKNLFPSPDVNDLCELMISLTELDLITDLSR